MSRRSVNVTAVLCALICVWLVGRVGQTPAAEPVPSVPGESVSETLEEYEWKGEKRKRTIRKLTLGGEEMEFVKVPKGSFMMGSPDSDKEAWAWEKPQHKVTFTKPLWVAKYPVTKGQFAAFAKSAKFETDAEKDGKGGYGFEGLNAKRTVQNPKYTWGRCRGLFQMGGERFEVADPTPHRGRVRIFEPQGRNEYLFHRRQSGEFGRVCERRR